MDFNTTKLFLINRYKFRYTVPIIGTHSEEEPGTFNSLDITQQNNTQTEQQISHIQLPTSTFTSTVTNSTLTTTQLDYTRQSYKVPSYYANSLSYVNSRRRR